MLVLINNVLLCWSFYSCASIKILIGACSVGFRLRHFADVALEQLWMARTKKQNSTHVLLVCRLLTPKWLKQLWKACDVVLSVPAGTRGWPIDMYEPVQIGVCFLFLSFQPWQFRGVPKIFQMARKLRSVFKEDEVDARIVSRKFWKSCHRIHACLARGCGVPDVIIHPQQGRPAGRGIRPGGV